MHSWNDVEKMGSSSIAKSCVSIVSQTLFRGHELTKSGVRSDQRKIDAIKHMPAPTDRQGVLRLLGMATYLAKLCAQFSEATAPIRALLKGENEFYWNPDVQGKAQDKSKHC